MPSPEQGPRRRRLLTAGLQAGFGGRFRRGRAGDSVLARLGERATNASRVSLDGRPALSEPETTPRSASRPRYEILDEIARGGIGVVLRGRDVDLGREVAFKVLREDRVDEPGVLERFLEEAQIGGQLQHPGIVPIYDLGLRGARRPYFTMKLIRGDTLAHLLRARPHAGHDLSRFLSIFLRICQTIAYAHSRGVIHRDLKPANVMVGEFGEVQVVDWGLSKVLRGASNGANTPPTPSADFDRVRTLRLRAAPPSDSVTGSVFGTPAYMPPEQARGDVAAMDRRSDVFALGAMLLEILSGAPPYFGTKEEMLGLAARGDTTVAIQRLSRMQVDAELAALCRHCLRAERAERPADAQEMAVRLDAHLSAVEARARTASLDAAEARGRESQERRARQLTVALAASVLAAAAIGGGSWWRLDQTARARAERTEQTIGTAMQEANQTLGRAESAMEASLWREVLAAIDRLDSALAAGEPTLAVRAHVAAFEERARRQATDGLRIARNARDNAALLARFEEIRVPSGDDVYEEPWPEIERAYSAALAVHGVAIDEGAVADAAGLIQERGLEQAFAFGVDDWARVRRAIQDDAGARRLWSIALEVDPDSTRSRLRHALLEADFPAIRDVATSAEASRLPPPTLDLLGSALAAAGEWAEAGRVYQLAARRNPRDFASNCELARWCAHASTNQPRKAVEYARVAIALRPENVAMRHLIVQILSRRLRDPASAVVELEDALLGHPDDLHLLWHLAVVKQSSGDGAGARNAWERIADSTPTRPREVIEHAQALDALGRHEEVLAHLRTAAELHPDAAEIHVELGRRLNDANDWRGSQAEFEMALRIQPRYGPAYESYGLLLAFHGQLPRAIALLQKAVELRPTSSLAHENLGRALGLAGRRPESVRALKRALELEPASYVAFLYLADSLEELGSLAEAEQAYREALRLAPEDVGVLNNFSLLLVRKGRGEEAVPLAERAAQKSPRGAVEQNTLGMAYRACGRAEDAIRSFTNATRIDQRFANAWFNLGLALVDADRLEEALAALSRAVALSPQDADFHGSIGLARYFLGDLPGALQECEQALSLDGSQSTALRLIPRIHHEQGRLAEAMERGRVAHQAEPDSGEVLEILASILEDSGDAAGARCVFEEALRRRPDSWEVRTAFAEFLRRAGEYSEAKSETAEALRSQPENDRLRRMAARLDELSAARVRLDAVVQGTDDPADDELLTFAEVADVAGRFATATALYERLFALPGQVLSAAPAIVSDASASAALASQEASANAPPEAAASRGESFRIQALEWLRIALDGFRIDAQSADVSARADALRSLRRWTWDPRFAAVRDAKRIAAFSNAERDELGDFWVDVERFINAVVEDLQQQAGE